MTVGIICGLNSDCNGYAKQCRANPPKHLWEETVYAESLMFTLFIFQGVSLPTLSDLVQWTPLVVEVHFLALLHLKGVSSVFFETVSLYMNHSTESGDDFKSSLLF